MLTRSLPQAVCCATLLLGAVSYPARASADNEVASSPDVVILKDGSRLRGTVIEEDPKRGVTILLVDGSTRKVEKAAVARVDYAPPPSAAPAAAPPASGTPTSPPMVAVAPPPLAPVVYSSSTSASAAPKMERRSDGAYIAGLVITPIGCIVALAGVLVFTNAQGNADSGGQSLGGGLMAGGLLVGVGGLVLTLVGGARHTVPSTAAQSFVPALRLGSAGSPVVVEPTGQGLRVRF